VGNLLRSGRNDA